MQRTFGIGLGYQFEHMTDLKEGERPSARRLQARAAKSAIKRAQQIYNAEATRLELNAINDPVERSRRQVAMRQASDAEMAHIAAALSNLIPTDSLLDTKRQTKIQRFKRNYKRSSSHEIIVDSPDDESSSSVNSLLGRTENTTQSDEEFVKEFMKRQQEEDEDDSTVLV